MRTTPAPAAPPPESAAIACPVCGRPARAILLEEFIFQVLCHRCHAVWQISPVRH